MQDPSRDILGVGKYFYYDSDLFKEFISIKKIVVPCRFSEFWNLKSPNEKIGAKEIQTLVSPAGIELEVKWSKEKRNSFESKQEYNQKIYSVDTVFSKEVKKDFYKMEILKSNIEEFYEEQQFDWNVQALNSEPQPELDDDFAYQTILNNLLGSSLTYQGLSKPSPQVQNSLLGFIKDIFSKSRLTIDDLRQANRFSRMDSQDESIGFIRGARLPKNEKLDLEIFSSAEFIPGENQKALVKIIRYYPAKEVPKNLEQLLRDINGIVNPKSLFQKAVSLGKKTFRKNPYTQAEITKSKAFNAALFYQKCINIHPFTDGNGRTCRIGQLWILYRSGLFNIVTKKLPREIHYKLPSQYAAQLLRTNL